MLTASKAKVERTLHYAKTEGIICSDVTTMSSEPNNTILMNNNEIMIFNTLTCKSQMILEIEDQFTFDNNLGRFAISKDDKYLVYADSYIVAAIDLQSNNKIIQKKVSDDDSVIRKVHLL